MRILSDEYTKILTNQVEYILGVPVETIYFALGKFVIRIPKIGASDPVDLHFVKFPSETALFKSENGEEPSLYSLDYLIRDYSINARRGLTKTDVLNMVEVLNNVRAIYEYVETING